MMGSYNPPANDVELAMATHLEADDPHGSNAYTRSLVIVDPATVTDFQLNSATGTLANPYTINDNVFTTSSEYNNLSDYAIVDYGKRLKIKRWRHYGDLDNIGNGKVRRNEVRSKVNQGIGVLFLSGLGWIAKQSGLW